MQRIVRGERLHVKHPLDRRNHRKRCALEVDDDCPLADVAHMMREALSQPFVVAQRCGKIGASLVQLREVGMPTMLVQDGATAIVSAE